MPRLTLPLFFFVVAWLISLPLHASHEFVEHRLSVTLDPAEGHLNVEDKITFPSTIRSLEFSLNPAFRIEHSSVPIEPILRLGARHKAFRVTLPPGEREWHVRYQGKPEFSGRRTHGQMPLGVLAQDGAYLDGNSAWYPLSRLPVGHLDLEIHHPREWRALSVGRLVAEDGVSRWSTQAPVDDIYLIAGPFQRYQRRHADIDISVWLRSDEPALADRYRDVMGGYINHYSEMIGT